MSFRRTNEVCLKNQVDIFSQRISSKSGKKVSFGWSTMKRLSHLIYHPFPPETYVRPSISKSFTMSHISSRPWRCYPRDQSLYFRFFHQTYQPRDLISSLQRTEKTSHKVVTATFLALLTKVWIQRHVLRKQKMISKYGFLL